ncbi:MAG: hypothetical protein LUC34_03630, partial [Campylobacter sp.]|nr:hypothetical protein [Campylobacter sp.]
MDYKNIKEQIDSLNAKLDILENNGIEKVEPCIDVFKFNSNAEQLKKKAQAQNESVFFKNVFNNDDYYDNISSYIRQTKTSLYHKVKKAGISIDANKNLQDSLKKIQNIIEILIVEHQMMTKKNQKKLFFKNSNDKAKIRS